MVVRTYNDELQYLEKVSDTCWKIKKGFQPNMNVSKVPTFVLQSSKQKLLMKAAL